MSGRIDGSRRRTGGAARARPGALAAALLALAVASAAPAGQLATQEPSPAYESIEILRPAAGATVFDNAGDVEVTVAISPALRRGDRIVLSIDGGEVAQGGRTRFKLSGIDRGAHSLQAEAVDRHAESLIVSKPVTFYMWRASRLFPNRR